MKTRIAIAAAMTLCSTSALAVPVTYDFSATGLAARLFGPPGTVVVPSELQTGTPGEWSLSGSITVEHDVVDEYAGPTFGFYSNNILDFSVALEGFDFAYHLGLPSTYNQVAIDSNDGPKPPGIPPANTISIIAAGFQPSWLAGLGSGQQLAGLQLSYYTSNLDELDSDALPADLSTVGNYGLGVSIYDSIGGQSWTVYTPTAIQLTRRPAVEVPEPGTFALIGAGLAALGFRRRGGMRAGAAGTTAGASRRRR
jgi:hypothetical protein